MQLSDGYAQDWKADKRSIYLVLWFGEHVRGEHKKLKPPGKGLKKPDTPEELKKMLEDQCKAFKDGYIEIFVLDIAIDAAKG